MVGHLSPCLRLHLQILFLKFLFKFIDFFYFFEVVLVLRILNKLVKLINMTLKSALVANAEAVCVTHLYALKLRQHLLQVFKARRRQDRRTYMVQHFARELKVPRDLTLIQSHRNILRVVVTGKGHIKHQALYSIIHFRKVIFYYSGVFD